MKFRHVFLSVAVLIGFALCISTEVLSLFDALHRPWIALFWVTAIAIAYWKIQPVTLDFHIRWDPVVLLCCVAIGAIVTLTGITAAFSPPNSSDAMAYHMPRVVYWAEQGSVRFFPTQYLNQIMLQPFAEYAMLHLYLLAGSDRLINLIQWFAALGSIVGVFAVAARFGANARGQAIAALFCATIPAGILAASGAKNDWVLALWLVSSVYFALCFTLDRQLSDAILLGMAIGCALLTKATAYLFLPPVLVAIFLSGRLRRWRPIAIALGVVVLTNSPQYFRNYDLSESILGFDSAQGNGLFRWRNETFGWKQTTSNALRHLSEQLGARSERWNQSVYNTVVSVHRLLAIDVNDPATTWRWSEYHAPKNANHEADAPNRWHLAALIVLSSILWWRAARGRPSVQAAYAVGLVVGFAAFCFYLKWQPFMGRLFVPLFVAGAPLAGLAGDIEFRPAWAAALLQAALCLLLLDGVRRPVLENWVRPLKGPKSVLHVPLHDQYFADMIFWNNQGSYQESADILAASQCKTMGIDITNLQLEYPLMALVRAKAPDTLFVHTNVENASKKYRQPVDGTPCAVVCLDCKDDGSRAAVYSKYQRSIPVAKFILYFREAR